MDGINWDAARQPNYFGLAMKGFEQGRANRDERERRSAYDIADTNPQAARRQLMKAGDMQGARVLYGEEQDARADAATAAQKKIDAQLKVFGALSQVPEGRRLPALQRYAPVLQWAGLDPNELATATEDELSDVGLSMLTGKIKEAEAEYTLPPGAKRLRGDQVIADNPSAPPRPTIVPQGSTVLGPDNKPVYTAPKTYAPQRARSGGGGRGGKAKSYGQDEVTW